MALSATAIANKEDENPKMHKSSDKNMYINLGLIGDYSIRCLGSVTVRLVADPPDSVTVYDPAGTPVTTIPVAPGSGPTTLIAPTTTPLNTCLGGSMAEYVPNSSDGTAWNVWIRDYVYNGCDNTERDGTCGAWEGLDDLIEDALETADGSDGGDPELGTAGDNWQVDLKVAGFAEMRQTVTKAIDPKSTAQTKSTQTCLPAEPTATPGAAVCVVSGQGVSQSHTRNINQFGFCGQGEISSSSTPAMRDPDDYANPSPPNGDYTDFSTVKAVFVDGVVFYSLDCPLAGDSSDFQDEWFFAASTVNGVTCPGIVCIFEEIPSVSSGCYAAKQAAPAPQTVNVAVAGLIGEVGWKYTASLACDENPVHGAWSNPSGAPQMVPDPMPLVYHAPFPDSPVSGSQQETPKPAKGRFTLFGIGFEWERIDVDGDGKADTTVIGVVPWVPTVWPVLVLMAVALVKRRRGGSDARRDRWGPRLGGFDLGEASPSLPNGPMQIDWRLDFFVHAEVGGSGSISLEVRLEGRAGESDLDGEPDAARGCERPRLL